MDFRVSQLFALLVYVSECNIIKQIIWLLNYFYYCLQLPKIILLNVDNGVDISSVNKLKRFLKTLNAVEIQKITVQILNK